MESRIRFTTIGYIEWRKGQDILIDAISEIPDELLRGCEFVLVGQDSSTIAQRLRERISEKPWIKMMGVIDRDKIHEILDSSEVLVCPSREDPMPTVCAEAMMHSVPCIVSDAVGTTKYIDDGINGLIFKSESIEELKNKIIWCINNRTELSRMGKEARYVYEQYFSEAAFEKNIMKYVEEIFNKDTYII